MKNKGILHCILLLLSLVILFPQIGNSQIGYVWGKVLRSPAYGDFGLDVECDAAGNVFASGDYRDNCTIGGNLYQSFGTTDVYLSKQQPNGQYSWVSVKGSPTTDRQFAVRVGQDQHLYTTGYGLIIFPFSRASQHQWDALTIRYRPDGSIAWGHAMNGDVYSEGREIAVDASGNSYTVGFMKTKGWWDTDSIFGNGLEDAFVVKFDSSGAFKWAKNFGGTLDDEGLAADVDAAGNIWIGGFFQGTASFGSTTLTSGGGNDAFIAKLNPNGNVMFVRQFSGLGNSEVYRLKLSADGDCYFTGNFDGDITFPSSTSTSSDLTDIFYGKMDNAGNVLWTKQAGGTNDDQIQDIALDDEENIYFGGFFFGSFDWQASSTTSAGYDDAFFAKTDSNGTLIFLEASHFAAESRDIFGVAVDPAQNMILTGKYAQRIEFGTDTFYSQNNSSDAFIAKYATRNQEIVLRNVNGTPFCVGDNFQVTFKAYGNFQDGNVFSLELSNSTGNFSSPTTIGSLVGVFGGTITGTIPAGISNGTGYRVRVSSSLPQITSADNGYDISLSPTTAIPVQIMGDTVICAGLPNLMTIDQGFSNQLWSTGDTTYYVLITQPGLLLVEATDANGCTNTDEVMMVSCVGLVEKEIDPRIEIFPNPSFSGRTTLRFENLAAGSYSLKVFDLQGKLRSQSEFRSDGKRGSQQLSTEGFPAGLYFVKIIGNEQTFSQKLLLQ